MLHLLAIVQLPQPMTMESTPASFGDLARYLAMTLLVPILAAGAKMAANAISNWAEAKGARWAAANAKVTALIADAIAFVEAETKAERIKILEDGKVTAEEAAELQKHALEAAKRFLGASGLRLITDTLGVAAPALDDWLKGRLQAVFAAPSAAVQMAGPAGAIIAAPRLVPFAGG